MDQRKWPRAHRTNLEVLSNFTDKTLEGKLADEELRRLLVPTDLTKGHCTRAETMGLLHTTSGLCGMACQFHSAIEPSAEDIQRELSFWRQRIWQRVVYGEPCLSAMAVSPSI